MTFQEWFKDRLFYPGEESRDMECSWDASRANMTTEELEKELSNLDNIDEIHSIMNHVKQLYYSKLERGV